LHDINDNNDDDVASAIEYAENNHPNHASNNDVECDNAIVMMAITPIMMVIIIIMMTLRTQSQGGGTTSGKITKSRAVTSQMGPGEMDPPGTAHYRTPRGEETRGKLNCKFSSRENAGKQCV